MIRTGAHHACTSRGNAGLAAYGAEAVVPPGPERVARERTLRYGVRPREPPPSLIRQTVCSTVPTGKGFGEFTGGKTGGDKFSRISQISGLSSRDLFPGIHFTCRSPTFVMPGLDPGIHTARSPARRNANGMDHRVKPGGDD